MWVNINRTNAEKIRCPERESNPLLTDFMTGALPLSYRGNYSGMGQYHDWWLYHWATKATTVGWVKIMTGALPLSYRGNYSGMGQYHDWWLYHWATDATTVGWVNIMTGDSTTELPRQLQWDGSISWLVTLPLSYRGNYSGMGQYYDWCSTTELLRQLQWDGSISWLVTLPLSYRGNYSGMGQYHDWCSTTELLRQLQWDGSISWLVTLPLSYRGNYSGMGQYHDWCSTTELLRQLQWDGSISWLVLYHWATEATTVGRVNIMTGALPLSYRGNYSGTGQYHDWCSTTELPRQLQWDESISWLVTLPLSYRGNYSGTGQYHDWCSTTELPRQLQWGGSISWLVTLPLSYRGNYSGVGQYHDWWLYHWATEATTVGRVKIMTGALPLSYRGNYSGMSQYHDWWLYHWAAEATTVGWVNIMTGDSTTELPRQLQWGGSISWLVTLPLSYRGNYSGVGQYYHWWLYHWATEATTVGWVNIMTGDSTTELPRQLQWGGSISWLVLYHWATEAITVGWVNIMTGTLTLSYRGNYSGMGRFWNTNYLRLVLMYLYLKNLGFHPRYTNLNNAYYPP